MLEQSASKILELITNARQSDTREIITLVGPNGSGKTRLLQNLKTSLYADGGCIDISVGRASALNANRGSPDTWPMQTSELNTISDIAESILFVLSDAQREYMPRPKRSITEVLAHYFAHVAFVDDRIKKAHRAVLDRIYEAHEDPNKPVHLPPKPRLLSADVADRLEEILGYKCSITRTVDLESMGGFDIKFKSGCNNFSVYDLSSGEKQILLISIISLTEYRRSVAVIVDEPELFLNERRAIEIWERVEQSFPKSTFVYATHNLLFATRPQVARSFVLSKRAELETIDLSRPFPGEMARQIVGARIQILRSELPPVFCEDGVAKLLIEDILGPGIAEVTALSGCRDVEQAMSGESHWHRVRTSGGRACGVLDRDLRSDCEIAFLANRGLLCLDVNEAEAILLEPIFVSSFLTVALGRTINEDECKSILVHAAKASLAKNLKTLSQDLAQKYASTITYTSEAAGISDIRVTAPRNVGGIFEEKASSLFTAINEQNVKSILRLFGSKELYKQVRSIMIRDYKLHISEAEQHYRTNRHLVKLSIANVEWADSVRRQIMSHISL